MHWLCSAHCFLAIIFAYRKYLVKLKKVGHVLRRSLDLLDEHLVQVLIVERLVWSSCWPFNGFLQIIHRLDLKMFCPNTFCLSRIDLKISFEFVLLNNFWMQIGSRQSFKVWLLKRRKWGNIVGELVVIVHLFQNSCFVAVLFCILFLKVPWGYSLWLLPIW